MTGLEAIPPHFSRLLVTFHFTDPLGFNASEGEVYNVPSLPIARYFTPLTFHSTLPFAGERANSPFAPQLTEATHDRDACDRRSIQCSIRSNEQTFKWTSRGRIVIPIHSSIIGAERSNIKFAGIWLKVDSAVDTDSWPGVGPATVRRAAQDGIPIDSSLLKR